MYLSFFGLAEKPFAITPDPRYLYLSARHADALAHLVYGINEAGGFIQLTGEVGTGKTTTIRSLLARAPKDAEIALILNPRLSAVDFLRSLCEELGLGGAESEQSSTKELVDQLNRYLLRAHAQGRRVVLIVDEAQNLSPEVLEQIRLLTNLETETQKLLQIILIGQPELRRLLAREDLRQLAQRITARYHLDPLSREETFAYVRHRLRVAGATADLFTRGALREIYRVSRGIPRVINIISDRALLGAYTEDLHQVPASLVRRAGIEVFGQEIGPPWMPPLLGALAGALVVCTALVLWRLSPHWLGKPNAHRAVAAAPVTKADPPALASTASASPALLPDVRLGQWLTTHRTNSNADGAFATLLQLWQGSYQPGPTDGCTQARTQGLDCVMRRGSLAQLRLLDRPAILMLNDEAGASYDVVLRGMDDNAVLLQLGDTFVTVGIADLTHYWFGDYVLLWRPPWRVARDLRVGMHGEQVRQLRAQLERWQSGHDSPLSDAAAKDASDQYDQALVQQVQQFQRSHRLAVDGVAGIETQVALDAALATPNSPVLQRLALRQASTRGG
jgi:general secretion pathway protein A